MQQDGIQPNVHTYTTLMNAYARVGNREGAEGVLTRMIEAGITPNVFTYTVLINAYARAGDVEGAQGVLRRMKVKGVEPNLMTYNTFLTAMVKQAERHNAMTASQAQQALQLYRWLRAPDNSHGIQADAATVSLMMACATFFPNEVLLNVYDSLVGDLARLVPLRRRQARLFLQAIELCAIVQDQERIDSLFQDAQELERRGVISTKELGRVAQAHRSHGGILREPPSRGGNSGRRR